jgi:hypothetical protein
MVLDKSAVAEFELAVDRQVIIDLHLLRWTFFDDFPVPSIVIFSHTVLV